MMVLRGFIDTQCGFKCFNRDKAVPVFSKMSLDGFCFDVELLFIAKKLGLKIKEVPVLWKDVAQSRVNILSEPVRMFLDLLRIRRNNENGFYD